MPRVPIRADRGLEPTASASKRGTPRTPWMRLRVVGVCLPVILMETKTVCTVTVPPRFLPGVVQLTKNTGLAAVELDPTLDFIAGTVAGVSGLVVGFPFDTGERPPSPKREKLLKTSS
jgi:hypothetical protein